MPTTTDTTTTYGLEIQVPYPSDPTSNVLTASQTLVGELDPNTNTVSGTASLVVPAPLNGTLDFRVRLTNVGSADLSAWSSDVFYQIFSAQVLTLGISDAPQTVRILATPFLEMQNHVPLLGTAKATLAPVPGLTAGETDLLFDNISLQTLDQDTTAYGNMQFTIRFLAVLKNGTEVYVIPGDPDMIVIGSDS